MSKVCNIYHLSYILPNTICYLVYIVRLSKYNIEYFFSFIVTYCLAFCLTYTLYTINFFMYLLICYLCIAALVSTTCGVL